MDWSENILVDLKKDEVFKELDQRKDEIKTGGG
jgi:chaperonin cofactor prefoldin